MFQWKDGQFLAASGGERAYRMSEDQVGEILSLEGFPHSYIVGSVFDIEETESNNWELKVDIKHNF